MTNFSILIANYNNGRFFKDCYDSIIAQTYINWEVIIVDDASTDDSLELINQLIQGDNRFKLYINDVNGGCGYTKRRCAELAKGEICGFLDPDDALTPQALEVMVNEHEKHPEISLVYSNFYSCTPELKIKKTYKSQCLGSTSYLESLLYVTHFASFKTDLYLKSGGIDPFVKRAVDQDLYYKCEEVAPIKYVDAVLYKYRVHNKGISTSNLNRSIAWHYYVIIEACKRREIQFEDILAKRIAFSKNTILQKITNYIKSLI